MKKILFGLLFLGVNLIAQVTNLPVTVEFVKSNKMKIIDIRTEAEWREMGVIKDAYLITFFDENKGYNIKKFLNELNSIVKKDEQFAIICNTASRTKLVSNFLGKKLNYDVVNLTGGMVKLMREGFEVSPYPPIETEKKSRDEISVEESNTTK